MDFLKKVLLSILFVAFCVVINAIGLGKSIGNVVEESIGKDIASASGDE